MILIKRTKQKSENLNYNFEVDQSNYLKIKNTYGRNQQIKSKSKLRHKSETRLTKSENSESTRGDDRKIWFFNLQMYL